VASGGGGGRGGGRVLPRMMRRHLQCGTPRGAGARGPCPPGGTSSSMIYGRRSRAACPTK
jgi:hypothetical protein